MGYVVFAQTGPAVLPLADILARGRAHSPLDLHLLEPSRIEDVRDAARIRVSAFEISAEVRLAVRPVTPDDVVIARVAERRGNASGMGELAARCPALWRVEPEPLAPEWLILELCALLAFAALGPVLPPDAATLLGVRSARERAAKLREKI